MIYNVNINDGDSKPEIPRGLKSETVFSDCHIVWMLKMSEIWRQINVWIAGSSSHTASEEHHCSSKRTIEDSIDILNSGDSFTDNQPETESKDDCDEHSSGYKHGKIDWIRQVQPCFTLVSAPQFKIYVCKLYDIGRPKHWTVF